jgi:L-2-hydroxyglutarate oxidase
MKRDCIVVGGGLVGLSTAYHFLLARPGSSVCVLEKEPRVADHQSTRNSGVIHTGVYYKPGSYKAQLCIKGRLALLEFAAQHNIEHAICGKLIVATSPAEMDQLTALHARGQTNHVRVQLLTSEEMKEREPYVTGLGAIWVPDAGVIDFRGLAEALVAQIRSRGGEVLTGAHVISASRAGEEWSLSGTFSDIRSSYVVNCAGLYSDRIARVFGERPLGQIVPFRGEYYVLKESARKLCNSLIYPVPDPRFPFLGVHFTRRFDGSVECGPNAVPAFTREGYSWREFHLTDVADMLGFSGFRHLARRHWRMGAGEMYRSVFKSAFVKALQKLVPAVTAEDLVPGGSGVRAQLVQPAGELEQDFAFSESPGALHVLNAPSPAATSCLAIGEEVVKRILGEKRNARAAEAGRVF